MAKLQKSQQSFSNQVQSVTAMSEKLFIYLFSDSELFVTLSQAIKAQTVEGSDYTNSADHITTSCLFRRSFNTHFLPAFLPLPAVGIKMY